MIDIGKRVCIVGLSSSGKSTLAHVIGQKKGLEVLHLDQLHHQPNTQWVPRDRDEFHKDHDSFIQKEKWVIDGTYSKCLPQRLARADTLIILKFGRWGALYRFIKRALFSKGDRYGVPEGAREQITWSMIRFILRDAHQRHEKMERMAAECPHLNIVRLKSFKEIDQFVNEL